MMHMDYYDKIWIIMTFYAPIALILVSIHWYFTKNHYHGILLGIFTLGYIIADIGIIFVISKETERY